MTVEDRLLFCARGADPYHGPDCIGQRLAGQKARSGPVPDARLYTRQDRLTIAVRPGIPKRAAISGE